MTRFRVPGTNPTNFSVSNLDRTFAFFRNVPGFARTRRQETAKTNEMVLLSLLQADSR